MHVKKNLHRWKYFGGSVLQENADKETENFDEDLSGTFESPRVELEKKNELSDAVFFSLFSKWLHNDKLHVDIALKNLIIRLFSWKPDMKSLFRARLMVSCTLMIKSNIIASFDEHLIYSFCIVIISLVHIVLIRIFLCAIT